MIEHRAYIVAEIPEPVRSQVQALRDSLNTLTAKLPVEITLAGSSGVGPIPVGTDLSLIKWPVRESGSRLICHKSQGFLHDGSGPLTAIFLLCQCDLVSLPPKKVTRAIRVVARQEMLPFGFAQGKLAQHDRRKSDGR